mgnify:FL=1
MAKTFRRGLIYAEDLAIGSGTALRGTSTGGTQTLTKINLSTFGAWSVVSVTTTPYTLSATSATVLVTVSGAATINLPTAVGNSGLEYLIKNLTGNTVTIDASGTQTIDGGLTYALTMINEYVRIISDGSNWQIVGAN